MKDLGREERGKKGAMSRQWREIGLLTKGTGPADGRAATYRLERRFRVYWYISNL